MFSLVGSRERGTLHTLCLLLPQVMNGTGPRRQFIPKAARLSSRAAFDCWGAPPSDLTNPCESKHLRCQSALKAPTAIISVFRLVSNSQGAKRCVCHFLLALLRSATGDRCRRSRPPTASGE